MSEDERFALMQAFCLLGAVAQDDADPREALDPRMSAFDAMQHIERIVARTSTEVRSHAPVSAIRSLCEYGRYVAQAGSVVSDDCDKIEKWLSECSREAVGLPRVASADVPPKPAPLENIRLRWDGSLPPK